MIVIQETGLRGGCLWRLCRIRFFRQINEFISCEKMNFQPPGSLLYAEYFALQAVSDPMNRTLSSGACNLKYDGYICRVLFAAKLIIKERVA